MLPRLRNTSNSYSTSSSNTTSRSAAPATNTTNWCVVENELISRTSDQYFNHFPHASEVLLPCWSHFYEEGLIDNCGIDLRLTRKMGMNDISPWVRTLVVDVMNCTLREKDDSHEIAEGDAEYRPNLYKMHPRFEYIRYLNSPEHAHALRRRIISDSDIDKVKGKGKPLQIGMVQRPKGRRVDNMEDIRDALQQALPDASINVTEFEFKTLKQQAWYFASKDIIISPHGAALTNSIFITPNTIVLQMHPDGYFWQSLEPLIEQSGGIALDWHDRNGGNPYIKYRTSNWKEKSLAAFASFVVPPEEIVERILLILGHKPANRDGLNHLLGNSTFI